MRRLVMSGINSHPASTHLKATTAAATASGAPVAFSSDTNKIKNQMMTAPAVTVSHLPAVAPPGPSVAQPTAVLPCAALKTPARAFHDHCSLVASSRQTADDALLAVLRRCERTTPNVSNIHKRSCGDVSDSGASRNQDNPFMDKVKAGTEPDDLSLVMMLLRDALDADLPLISDALLAADWEIVAHLFNAAVADVALSKKKPALEGYGLPAEEIAAVVRDVGHPLRRLVNQISYAEHGAVDVSGLYRQVRHAAYAPPVVVPDAEVAAFAQCLLQQTSAMEHALAASATATGAAAVEATPKRPKKTKRARSSSSSKQEETSKDPSTTDALLDIFNQAVRSSVPTCAEWSFTDAMIAEVTGAARAMILCSHDDDDAKAATAAAARRVLEALVVANGRILGTITLQGAPPPMATSKEGGGDVKTASITEAACGRWIGGETAQPTWITHNSCPVYRDNTVYVRAVYEELWAQLSDPKRSFGWDLPGAASPVLLLVGSPGIGKSWALNYLLYKAVTEERVGCPKRLVMLQTMRSGFWAFLPDGRVLELRNASCRGPPQRLIEHLVQQYATPPTSTLNATAIAKGAEVNGTSADIPPPPFAAPPPALLLYDALGCRKSGSRSDEAATLNAAMIVPNMITVMTPSLPEFRGGVSNESVVVKDVRALVAHRVVETFYVPPLGEHEFKAFFKGHFAVERALDEIKKKKANRENNMTDSKNEDEAVAAEEVGGAEALVAEEFAKFGGVLRKAFDEQEHLKTMYRVGRCQGAPQVAHHCFRRETPNEFISMVPAAASAASPTSDAHNTNSRKHRKNSDYALEFRSPYMAQQFAERALCSKDYVSAVHDSHRKTLDHFQQSLQTNTTLKKALKEGCDGLKRAHGGSNNNNNNKKAMVSSKMVERSALPPVQSVFDVSNAIATLLFDEKKKANTTGI